MDFGFTNDLSKLVANREFRDAAVQDGWAIEPTYGHESVDSYATLKKEGFVMHVCCREKCGKWRAETQITIWGPDGLQISVPDEYDWNRIIAATTTCLECGARDVETVRVGFAGRSCKSCLPKARKEQEYPGWTN